MLVTATNIQIIHDIRLAIQFISPIVMMENTVEKNGDIGHVLPIPFKYL